MASWSFNPFTGNLDLVGSGGGSTVFEGEVATFADLPVTVGDPAVGAAFLVRESTGVWLVNRRQAGIYIRRNNTGVAATDWEYGGDYPVTSVNNQTGNVVLTASSVGAAATSHTHAVSDVSGAVPTSRTISAGTGLTGGGDLTANRTLAVSYGSSAGTACEGNDPRLSDSRTPSAHAASHQVGREARYAGKASGMATKVIIVADNVGAAGNSISLSFNGTDTIETVLAAWNAANPSSAASVVAGDEDQIPSNGQTITLSGGVNAGTDTLSPFNQSLNTTDSVAFSGFTVGDGEVIAVGDNYGQFTSINSNTGFIINRGQNNNFASLDFLEGGSGASGWSIQLQPSIDDLAFANRVQSFNQLTLPASGDVGCAVVGDISVKDRGNDVTATFVAQENLSDNRSYQLPDADGTLALTTDNADQFGSGAAADGYVLTADGAGGVAWEAVSGGSGGVTDGDKGDISVSSSGATWTIDNNAVTYAKLQDISATSRILGRKTASAGDTEECTLSEILDFVGSAAQGDILYRGASTWTRLAAGTSGHYLKTNGSGNNPEWAAVSGGSGGTKTYATWIAYNDNQPPATGFSTIDVRNGIGVLDFDDASTESAVFVGIMPEGASLGSGLIVNLDFMATSATSGNVRWSVAFERCTTDLDSDSFDTATAATVAVASTSGVVAVGSITCTAIDSIAAGDLFRLRVQRLGGDAADSASGDIELVAVEVRSAA